jgi:hypothetical protein
MWVILRLKSEAKIGLLVTKLNNFSVNGGKESVNKVIQGKYQTF